tara:strand:+ start:2245 stop:3438 length:1194 start_codon:yes stop_codon:yes gene_type:complete
MARRTLYPKKPSSTPLDALQKILGQLGTEVSRQQRQDATLEYYRDRDAAKATQDAKDDATDKENKFRDEYHQVMFGYLKSGDYRTARAYLGEVDGEEGKYTYDMARDSMVEKGKLPLYYSATQWLDLINKEETQGLKGENLAKSFLSRNAEIDKSDIYDNMLDALGNGDMSQAEFDFAMKNAKSQPWFESLGLSAAEKAGGPSADSVQADLKTVGGLFRSYEASNFYKQAEAFTWANATYTPQGYTKLLQEAGITSKSSDTERREEFLKNLWRTKKSSPAAVALMDEIALTALDRGVDKDGPRPNLFEILGEGVKPGESRGQQYFVNTYVGLAIEADPELRGINNRSELIEKLNNSETQARIVRRVEEYLGPYDTWRAYMATPDEPNPRFRIKLIED